MQILYTLLPRQNSSQALHNCTSSVTATQHSCLASQKLCFSKKHLIRDTKPGKSDFPLCCLLGQTADSLFSCWSYLELCQCGEAGDRPHLSQSTQPVWGRDGDGFHRAGYKDSEYVSDNDILVATERLPSSLIWVCSCFLFYLPSPYHNYQTELCTQSPR